MVSKWALMMCLAYSMNMALGRIILLPPYTHALRLRGGGQAHRSKVQEDHDHVMTVDLPEDEDQARVKSQTMASRRPLVLGASSPGMRQEDDAEDLTKSFAPVKFHAHGNKVVMERRKPKILEPKTIERTSISTAKIDKKKTKVVKKSSINCTLAVAHNLFNVTDFALYLKQRIKVDGKLGNLEGSISVDVDNDTHTVKVSAFKPTQKKKRVWSKRLIVADTFSTRYLRYLTKKWICKLELKDYIRCVSTDFSKASLAKGGAGSKFEIRYTNMHKNRHLRHKMSRLHGTRLEQARREYLDKQWWAHDANKTRIPRAELLMERRIRATGERVGGLSYINATCKTVAEWEAFSKDRLRHWAALQEATYRMPFGGAMRGMLDRSICRHDPDRVGKGAHTHSTAGYTSPRVLRSRTGLRVGVESLLYTGTAPDGFKSARRRAVAQRLLEGYQKTRRHVTKGFSVQGEGDRRIYNWRPKWLLAGKMDLHKRDWR